MAEFETGTRTFPGVQAIGWINVLLGVLVVAVPFFTVTAGTAFWSNAVAGVLVALLGVWSAWNAAAGRVSRPVVPAAVAVLGLWLIGTPFFLDASAAYAWATVLLGVLVLLAGIFNAWVASTYTTP